MSDSVPSGAGYDDGLDVVVVGAGFAGLYMLHRLRGLGFSTRVYEQAHGVGGTWYWNRYPGARCDIESMQYSYQFDRALEQEWDWTERYAAQPEILRYANHVADRFDLRRDIRFGARVLAAAFEEITGRWMLRIGTGERVYATYCIMATGCLSTPITPRIEGLDSFAGARYHTGTWPHDPVDFRGRRVGVIGTGSSAIQSIPVIAEQAEHLYVFQRTPNYAVPAHNHPLEPAAQAEIKKNYPEMRARAKTARNGVDHFPNPAAAVATPEDERSEEFESRWAHGGLGFLGAFADLIVDYQANEMAAEFIRSNIREVVVDPEVARLLMPRSTFGCKRLCVDIGYFEAYNRSNVTLVDVSVSPIERITPAGLVVTGEAYEFDTLVFATGFDAMTGTLRRIDIRGRGGRALKDKWEDGPRMYLGLASAGFPNLFAITGPGSPSVLSNMLPTIEQHVDWIADLLDYARVRGRPVVEATVEAEHAWVAHVNDVANRTVYPSCNSWYLGANVPGKPRVFMPYPGVPAYARKCEEVAADGYEGFTLNEAPVALHSDRGRRLPARDSQFAEAGIHRGRIGPETTPKLELPRTVERNPAA